MKKIFLFLLSLCIITGAFAQNKAEVTAGASLDSLTFTLESVAEAKSFQWDKLKNILLDEELSLAHDFVLCFEVKLTPREQEKYASNFREGVFSIKITDEPNPRRLFTELHDGVSGMLALLEE